MKPLPLTILLSFIMAFSAARGDDTPRDLALNECINIALENNTSIRVSDEDVNKALAEYRVARGQRLPFVAFDIKSQQYPRVVDTGWIAYIPDPVWKYYLTKQKVDEANKDNPLSKYYNLGISFGVVAGVSIYNKKKSRMQDVAEKGVSISKLNAKKTISETILNVKQAYYSYAMAREHVAMREDLVKSNADRLRVTEILYKNAQRPIIDLSKAQYEYGNSQLELERARNNERAMRFELFKIMGVSDPGYDIVPRDYDLPGELKYSLDELNSYGELHSIDLQIIRMQKKINKLKVDVEMAGHYPEVELQGGMAYENGYLNFGSFSENFKSSAWRSSFGAGFVARLPLYSGGTVCARVDSAKAEYQKSAIKEKEAAQSVRTTIRNFHDTLGELKKQLEVSKLMEENAKKHMLLARKTYESGAGTQLELHDANVSLANARMGYLKAKNDYLITIAKLCSIVGLGEDSLCKK